MAELKKAFYWQRGEVIDYTNVGESDIPANSIVIVGKKIGVAGTDIPVGEVGSLHMVGVFRIPKKASVALAAGDTVKFTDADGIDKSTTESEIIGYAVEAAKSEDTMALIKLLG